MLSRTVIALTLLAFAGVMSGCTVNATRGPLHKRHDHEHCHGWAGKHCHDHRHGPGHHP
jgi:hypothetical protein